MLNFLKKLVPYDWLPTPYLQRQIMRQNQGRVIAGPFQNLNYIRAAFCSALFPKILGVYELELQPVINEILRGRFGCLIDIGAAEGYYAIGFAVERPDLPVVAFEMAPEARELLQEMARINGVTDRLEIRAACDLAQLRALLAEQAGPPCLICDCEGYEEELLDPKKVPALSRASILVELHEFVSSGISQRIRGRFEASHIIQEIRAEKRKPEDFPFATFYTRLMPGRYLLGPMSEIRPENMNWFWMKPRT